VPGSEDDPGSGPAEFDRLVAELAEFLIAVPAEAWVDREEDAYSRYGRSGSPALSTLAAVRAAQYGGAK